ncbi:MAG: DUF5655 domain-containing protein [Cyclobacteriaceae bacterium]
MWTCPHCKQKFVKTNQPHSCGDKVLDDFLHGKSGHTVELFWHFIDSFKPIGKVTIHPTKSMIAIAAAKRMAYITRLGKNFVDVTFPFTQPYPDNLCFQKIAQVPGQQQFNHHLRLQEKDDVNVEVRKFMKLAYTHAC